MVISVNETEFLFDSLTPSGSVLSFWHLAGGGVCVCAKEEQVIRKKLQMLI